MSYEQQSTDRRPRRYSSQSMSIPVELMDALLRSGLLGEFEDEDEQDEPLEMHMTSVQLEDVQTHTEDPAEEVPVAEARPAVVECELD